MNNAIEKDDVESYCLKQKFLVPWIPYICIYIYEQEISVCVCVCVCVCECVCVCCTVTTKQKSQNLQVLPFEFLGKWIHSNLIGAIFFMQQLIELRGRSRTAATSKMEHFVTIITKRSILDAAAVLDPPLELIVTII